MSIPFIQLTVSCWGFSFSRCLWESAMSPVCSLASCYTAVLWSDLDCGWNGAIVSRQIALSVFKERWIKVILQLPSWTSVYCFLSDREISPYAIQLQMFRCFRLQPVSAASICFWLFVHIHSIENASAVLCACVIFMKCHKKNICASYLLVFPACKLFTSSCIHFSVAGNYSVLHQQIDILFPLLQYNNQFLIVVDRQLKERARLRPHPVEN